MKDTTDPQRDELIAELDALLATATPDEMYYINEARELNAQVDRMLAQGYTQNMRGEWIK